MKTLEHHNIGVAIVSNNRSKKRVERFVENLYPAHRMPYLYQAKKPSFHAIVDIVGYCGHNIRETALLGDRMRTDIAAANGAGIKA